MGSTHTRASAVVLAPVFTVARCLSDIGTIASCLPGVCSVQLDPGRQAVELAFQPAADARPVLAERYRLHCDHHHIDWQLVGQVNYQGSFTIFGDASVSQLTSTVRTDQPEWLDCATEQHQQMLRRLVSSIECAAQRPAQGAASPDSDGTFTTVSPAADRAG
jgi:hypothetical protein